MLPKSIQQAIGQVQRFESVHAIARVGSRANNHGNPDADDWDLAAYTLDNKEPTEDQRRTTWDALPSFAVSRAEATEGNLSTAWRALEVMTMFLRRGRGRPFIDSQVSRPAIAEYFVQ